MSIMTKISSSRPFPRWLSFFCFFLAILTSLTLPAQDYTYSVDDQTVPYDKNTGAAEFSVAVLGVEDADGDGYPNATQAFSVSIGFDPDVLTGLEVRIGSPFDELNDGDGPALLFPRLADDDNGARVGCVYHLTSDSEEFAWEDSVEVMIVDFETNREATEDNDEGMETDISFDDSILFQGVVVDQVVTVDGSAYTPTMNDGVITLEAVDSPAFLRGDVDNNGAVSGLLDAQSLLRWAFVDGDAPLCMDGADVDDDGNVTPLLDALGLLKWAFISDDAPPDPGTEECGRDPTDDDIGCDEPPECD